MVRISKKEQKYSMFHERQKTNLSRIIPKGEVAGTKADADEAAIRTRAAVYFILIVLLLLLQ